MTASPIFGDDGRIIGVSWIARDITRQILSKKALRESEKKYRAIFEHSAVGIGRVRPDGTFIEVNQKMCDIVGYTRDELLGKTFMSITHPEDIERSMTMVIRLLSGEMDSYSIEKRYIRMDGSVIYANLTVALVKTPEGKPDYMVPVVSDITECKQAENALQEVQANMALAQKNGHIGTWVWDFHKHELRWTSEICRMLGISDNFVPTYQKFLDFVVPEEKERVDKSVKDSLENGEHYHEAYWIKRPDGERRFVECEGDTIFEEDKPVKMLGICQDITERKQWETDLADARAQTEFYMDLMSHDINNMNHIALGFLEMALETFPLNKEEREFLDKPLETIRNSSRLIDNVRKLKHVREGDLKLRTTDLCELIKDVAVEYSEIPGRKVNISFTPIPQCYVIANDLIKDVFSNLIGNAIKHSDPHKPLTINIRLEQMTEEGKENYKILVEDDGPGIPDDLKGKLFVRFERGRTKAGGKGLGLYLVRTLVEDFRGKVWAEDRVPGDYMKGARFVVVIPAADTADN